MSENESECAAVGTNFFFVDKNELSLVWVGAGDDGEYGWVVHLVGCYYDKV